MLCLSMANFYKCCLLGTTQSITSSQAFFFLPVMWKMQLVTEWDKFSSPPFFWWRWPLATMPLVTEWDRLSSPPFFCDGEMALNSHKSLPVWAIGNEMRSVVFTLTNHSDPKIHMASLELELSFYQGKSTTFSLSSYDVCCQLLFHGCILHFYPADILQGAECQ